MRRILVAFSQHLSLKMVVRDRQFKCVLLDCTVCNMILFDTFRGGCFLISLLLARGVIYDYLQLLITGTLHTLRARLGTLHIRRNPPSASFFSYIMWPIICI